MIRLSLLLIAGLAFAHAANEQQEEFTLLQLAEQPSESLHYFLRRAPVEAPDSPDKPIKFEPLPDGITAHLSEVGYLVGRRLFAIRYLADTHLTHGNDGALGLVLLCSASSGPPRFAPLVVEEIVDDLSVSSVRHFGDFSFIWLRRDYSGAGN